ncbi:hypothetical protein [Winogradskyella endarachnes]|uniref:Uncharacterized protein n=1 Tax=Winogradskyella endarachnes TaxID=2681965 RepID=A0A6L6UBR8_9FLAO|nr:hypothetical protein [Winogradskyella endarachnes]MUU79683.1 hypothetical protein [Winogradskyella endarachnes]
MKRYTTYLFYQNLGRLFYAFVAVDKYIKPTEVEAVELLVKKYWLSNKVLINISKNDAEEAVFSVFRSLCNYNEVPSKSFVENCYNRFVQFKNENILLFTKDIKTLILKTVTKITAACAGQNKSETILLAKLSLEFNKKVKSNIFLKASKAKRDRK